MNRTLTAAMIAALSLPAPLVAAPRQGQNASVAGKAFQCTGQAIGNASVQVRDLSNGRSAGRATTASDGTFRLAGLPGGRYVIEVLNSAQQVIATSAIMNVPEGGSLADIAVRAGNCAPAAAAVGSVALAGASTGGGLSTAALAAIVAGAAAAGIGGIVAITNDNGSPSR